jgi:excinuclease UvrABC helicase subunit UvrB
MNNTASRAEIESLKDMLSAEQASHNELRRQMDVLAYDYTINEQKYKEEIERLRAESQQWQSYGMARNEQLVEAKAEVERLREALASASTEAEVNIAETTGYNAGLEWAARWIEGSASAEQKLFADNMAMSIRAAKVQVEQENFFDAVRNDPTMTPEQKAKWLSLEAETKEQRWLAAHVVNEGAQT